MSAVQSLIRFHQTRNFGNGQNLLACQREARKTYSGLSAIEIDELVDFAISQRNINKHFPQELLCGLACFQPGCLSTFHGRLLEERILFPGVIYFGADGEIPSASCHSLSMA